jgi:hypothetical protein
MVVARKAAAATDCTARRKVVCVRIWKCPHSRKKSFHHSETLPGSESNFYIIYKITLLKKWMFQISAKTRKLLPERRGETGQVMAAFDTDTY